MTLDEFLQSINQNEKGLIIKAVYCWDDRWPEAFVIRDNNDNDLAELFTQEEVTAFVENYVPEEVEEEEEEDEEVEEVEEPEVEEPAEEPVEETEEPLPTNEE